MITIWVPANAEPGGSKRHIGNGRVIDANKNAASWKDTVRLFASIAYKGPLLDGPLKVSCKFIRLRPKSHFTKTGALRKGAPEYPTTKPDATKLWRSTEDALTGIVWTDDARIVLQTQSKIFGTKPGALITIQGL